MGRWSEDGLTGLDLACKFAMHEWDTCRACWGLRTVIKRAATTPVSRLSDTPSSGRAPLCDAYRRQNLLRMWQKRCSTYQSVGWCHGGGCISARLVALAWSRPQPTKLLTDLFWQALHSPQEFVTGKGNWSGIYGATLAGMRDDRASARAVVVVCVVLCRGACTATVAERKLLFTDVGPAT